MIMAAIVAAGVGVGAYLYYYKPGKNEGKNYPSVTAVDKTQTDFSVQGLIDSEFTPG